MQSSQGGDPSPEPWLGDSKKIGLEMQEKALEPHLRHKIRALLSPPLSTHLLLPSSSYPWPPMVESLFLTHLLLEVASPITFFPFSILLPLIFEKQRTPLMKKIQCLQALHVATSIMKT
ncbi:hypothetical protein GmHk_01G001039 [Glycine max]|nr:hypothetical protein GmHk_01G001039 [Glycine max]